MDAADGAPQLGAQPTGGTGAVGMRVAAPAPDAPDAADGNGPGGPANRDVQEAARTLTSTAELPLAQRIAALEDVHRQLTVALDAPDGA